MLFAYLKISICVSDSWNYKSEDLENPDHIYIVSLSDQKSEIDIFSSGNVFIVGGDEFIFISKFSIF